MSAYVPNDKNKFISSSFCKASNTYNNFSKIQSLVISELLSLLGTDKFSFVLDVGCGTGNVYKSTLSNLNGLYFQCDISPSMCKQAMLCNGRPAVVSDMCQLPFMSRSFDLVICSMAMHWASSLSCVVQEFYRILKLSGVLLIAIPVFGTMNELYGLLSELYGVSSNFSTLQNIKDSLLNGGFCFADSYVRGYVENYINFREFCVSIKKTGVFAFNRVEISSIINPFRLSMLYRERYKSDSGCLPVSWNIAFIKVVKL